MAIKDKRRPTHPGELLREEKLPAAGLTRSEFASRLDVSRRIVSEVIHERRAVSPDLAHRLARVFNTTPEFWLRLQEAVDIWDTSQANREQYDRPRSPIRCTAQKPVDERRQLSLKLFLIRDNNIAVVLNVSNGFQQAPAVSGRTE